MIWVTPFRIPAWPLSYPIPRLLTDDLRMSDSLFLKKSVEVKRKEADAL